MPAISVDKYTPQSMLSESNCLQNMLIIYALGPVHEEFGVGIKAIPKAFHSRKSWSLMARQVWKSIIYCYM